MKKFILLILLLLAFSLYSRPKLEISLSNVHPAYPEWYKRYNLSLTMNPSSRFGLRCNFGTLDFEYTDFSINTSLYGGITGLLYFPGNRVSLYVLLRLSAAYDGTSDYYEEYSSFYLFTTTGFGVDWYFSDRAACFVELQDFLIFYCSRYYGETNVDIDGNPGIIFGLKFGIY
jgi:hypothetical protein